MKQSLRARKQFFMMNLKTYFDYTQSKKSGLAKAGAPVENELVQWAINGITKLFGEPVNDFY
jgi:hypothetical protein